MGRLYISLDTLAMEKFASLVKSKQASKQHLQIVQAIFATPKPQPRLSLPKPPHIHQRLQKLAQLGRFDAFEVLRNICSWQRAINFDDIQHSAHTDCATFVVHFFVL
jgi:hypothetical protein